MGTWGAYTLAAPTNAPLKASAPAALVSSSVLRGIVSSQYFIIKGHMTVQWDEESLYAYSSFTNGNVNM